MSLTAAASKPTPKEMKKTSPTAHQLTAASMSMAITTLGKKKKIPVKPKKPAPPQEDDIFASMGLVAKPTFSHAPPAAKAAPATSSQWPIPAPTTTSSALSATSANFNDNGSDDWSDDDDLNDLLDD
jgi:hypothetical protein